MARITILSLGSFLLVTLLCSCGDKEDIFPPVQCIDMGITSGLLHNEFEIVGGANELGVDLDRDNRIDFKVNYSFFQSVSGLWDEELVFHDIGSNVHFLGEVKADTVISFYRDYCYYRISKEEYTPETTDSLINEQPVAYLEVDQLEEGATICVEDDFNHYSDAICLDTYSKSPDSYNCGIIRYRFGNWSYSQNTGYVGFFVEGESDDYLGYLKIENDFASMTLTEIYYQRTE